MLTHVTGYFLLEFPVLRIRSQALELGADVLYLRIAVDTHAPAVNRVLFAPVAVNPRERGRPEVHMPGAVTIRSFHTVPLSGPSRTSSQAKR